VGAEVPLVERAIWGDISRPIAKYWKYPALARVILYVAMYWKVNFSSSSCSAFISQKLGIFFGENYALYVK